MKKISIDRAIMGLCIIGLLIGVYLTVYHYSNIPLLCPTNIAVINCENILNSQYSVAFGIPLPLIGLAFFMAEILLLGLKGRELLAFLNAGAVAVVIYLIYIEKLLGNICLYCTAIHIIVIALFLLSIYRMREQV